MPRKVYTTGVTDNTDVALRHALPRGMLVEAIPAATEFHFLVQATFLGRARWAIGLVFVGQPGAPVGHELREPWAAGAVPGQVVVGRRSLPCTRVAHLSRLALPPSASLRGPGAHRFVGDLTRFWARLRPSSRELLAIEANATFPRAAEDLVDAYYPFSERWRAFAASVDAAWGADRGPALREVLKRAVVRAEPLMAHVRFGP